MIKLSSGLPGTTGSSRVPPLRKVSYVVMSILPFRFFESWQAKQFSFKIGATSLKKLIGLLAGAGVCAEATGADSNRMPTLTAAPRMAHRTQKQNRLRNMVGRTPSRV